MKENATTKACSQCGSMIPPDAPQGLCPKCVLGGVATSTHVGVPADQYEAPPLDTIRRAFPQLEVVELIGKGGMGSVYKARQPNLDRFVALKLLWPKLGADPAFAERFNREARVLARLNHPNIVAVYDFGLSGGFFYLLMEFVDGVNLRQAMRAGRFAPNQALALVPKICEALQFAHEEGILHRDIKPENILLDTKGRVKIADFGIAKLIGEAREDLTLTASGVAIGTPHYMAPEQLERPQDVDQRADIYSLGVVFYEMLTGELPIGRFAPPSEKSTVDPRVDAVVFRALEREREKRYGSATEVKTSVENIATTVLTPAGPDKLASGKPSVAPAGEVPRSGRPSPQPKALLAIKLAVWTGLLVGLFAYSVPVVWKNWWPTIYKELYEIGLRPQSGAYPKVTLLAERRLYCWGQNQDQPFSKTEWMGKALLTLPGTDAPAIMELDSKLERCRWATPSGQTIITRQLPPRPQQAVDWMKSAGIDVSYPAVLEEAAELIRLVKEAADGNVPGSAGLRQRKAIANDRIGPFLVSGGDGWGFTCVGAMVVDQRLVIATLFLAIWLPGMLTLVRGHRREVAGAREGALLGPSQLAFAGSGLHLALCVLLSVFTLWFLLEFGPPTITMIQGPDLPLLALGGEWHLGGTVWSIFSKLAALTALLAAANFFAWRSYGRA